MLIDTEEYECTHDVLWEISDNVSETVQDRDIGLVAMKDLR